MQETIRQQIMVLSNYSDEVDTTENTDLIQDYYYYLGLLKGMHIAGMIAYNAVDSEIRNDIHNLYQELSDIEHQQSQAGNNK